MCFINFIFIILFKMEKTLELLQLISLEPGQCISATTGGETIGIDWSIHDSVQDAWEEFKNIKPEWSEYCEEDKFFWMQDREQDHNRDCYYFIFPLDKKQLDEMDILVDNVK